MRDLLFTRFSVSVISLLSLRFTLYQVFNTSEYFITLFSRLLNPIIDENANFTNTRKNRTPKEKYLTYSVQPCKRCSSNPFKQATICTAKSWVTIFKNPATLFLIKNIWIVNFLFAFSHLTSNEVGWYVFLLLQHFNKEQISVCKEAIMNIFENDQWNPSNEQINLTLLSVYLLCGSSPECLY